MSFSEVLFYMKGGKHAFRHGWNGKNIIVYYYLPDSGTLTDEQLDLDTVVNAHFRIWDKDKKVVDAWVPSISDLFATDWGLTDV